MNCTRCRQPKMPGQMSGDRTYCKACRVDMNRKHIAQAAARGVTLELIERFWSRVTKTDTCWLWNGSIRNVRDGYGQFWFVGRNRPPHVVALILAGREPPEGLVADHICKNTMCVRPDHLRYVTQRFNSTVNSISPMAKNAQQTHCKWGHPLSGDNIRTVARASRFSGGRRFGKCTMRLCIACMKRRSKEAWAKTKVARCIPDILTGHKEKT